MKKFSLTLLAVSIAIIGFSQERKSVTTNSQPKERVNVAQENANNIPAATVVSLDMEKVNLAVENNEVVVDVNDDYFGLKTTILSFLVADILPENFPTKESSTYEQYNKRLIGWARENFDLIKPEYLTEK